MAETTRTVLVTGAARGIGLATARLFLQEGWQVALLDIETATLDHVVKANIYPLFWLTKAASPHLKPGASIIT